MCPADSETVQSPKQQSLLSGSCPDVLGSPTSATEGKFEANRTALQ
jgi:hypothetical protein